MGRARKLALALGTFSVALGIGFVMQNSDALASRFGGDPSTDPEPFTHTPVQPVQGRLSAPLNGAAQLKQNAPASDSQVQSVLTGPMVNVQMAQLADPVAEQTPEVILPKTETANVFGGPASVSLAPIEVEAAPFVAETSDGGAASAQKPESVIAETDAPVCGPVITATAAPVATLDVTVVDPCLANTSFKIHHQGMMFSAKTDETGVAEMNIPALSHVAAVIAEFDQGKGAVTSVSVPDFGKYDRAVLQWQGDAAVFLSAYENGAAFEDEGHIFMVNPGSIERVLTGEGGYLTTVGDVSAGEAFMAQIYTYPTEMIDAGRTVVLVAEAEITEDNCGRDLSAQSIQVTPNGDAYALDLVVAMPDCDAIGDFLILQNMFQDLTLAMR